VAEDGEDAALVLRNGYRGIFRVHCRFRHHRTRSIR
jgi:hypothetical protein